MNDVLSSIHNNVQINNSRTYALIGLNPKINNLPDRTKQNNHNNNNVFESIIKSSKVYQVSCTNGAIVYSSNITNNTEQPQNVLMSSNHTNSFVDSVIMAHECNYTLELRPDDFWSAIIAQFSAYRHRNALSFESQSTESILEQFSFLFTSPTDSSSDDDTDSDNDNDKQNDEIDIREFMIIACNQLMFQEDKSKSATTTSSTSIIKPTLAWLLPVFSTTTTRDCIATLFSAIGRHNNHYVCDADKSTQLLQFINNVDKTNIPDSGSSASLFPAHVQRQKIPEQPSSRFRQRQQQHHQQRGIANIHLIGTPEDYRKLYRRVEYLLHFDNKERHTTQWLRFLLPVIEELVNIDRIGMNLNFWRCIIGNVRMDSSIYLAWNNNMNHNDDRCIGGWISAFCAFRENGNFSLEFGTWDLHRGFLFANSDVNVRRIQHKLTEQQRQFHNYLECYPIVLRTDIPSNAVSARILYNTQHYRILSGGLSICAMEHAIAPRIDYVLCRLEKYVHSTNNLLGLK